MPNSSGFGTDFRPIVTEAPRLAVERDERRQVEVAERVARDDEERVVELPDARRTEPAVPTGASSTEYSTCMPSDSPSPK